MFEHILVPLDGTAHTEVAIHPAIVLASQSHTALLFMSVVEPGYAHARRAYLSQWERASQVVCETDVVVGGAVAEQIIATARVHTPALVCMASHGRGPFGEALFGSTSTHVIRAIGAPVVAIGPHCAEVGSYSQVVVAVDDSEASAAVLPAAVELAAKIDAKVQIIQVIDNADLRRANEAGFFSDGLTEAAHVHKLARHLARQDIVAGWEVLHDRDAAHGIVAYLRDKPNAIVAMATHARSGLSLLSHHGVASHVVHRSANPVLLLH